MFFTAVIFTVLWLLQTVFLQNFYNGMVIKNTVSAAEKITSFSADGDISDTLDELSRNNSLLVYVTDKDGNILYSADEYKKGHMAPDMEEPEQINDKRQNKHMHYRALPDNFEDFRQELDASNCGYAEIKTDRMYFYGKYIDYGDSGEKAILYLGTNLDPVGSTARIISLQLLIVTVLSVAIGFVLALFMSRSFSKPISQLNQKAHTLGEDKASTDYHKGFCSELDDLNDTLDMTDEKLRKNKIFQNELLANVSHDLRTPLTMIKGYAEMIRDISHDDEIQCAEDVAVIVKETDRLTALVNEILEYSELQMTDTEPVMSDVDLSEIVTAVTDSFESLYRKDGYTFERNVSEDIHIRGNSSRLTRAVYNLLDNAVRHTGADKWVGITLKSENGKAMVEISDHGEGIAPEELDRIWDKYYTSRQRSSRTNSVGAGVSGLGLAIVRQTVSQHKGKCCAESKLGKGSVFRIEFDLK